MLIYFVLWFISFVIHVDSLMLVSVFIHVLIGFGVSISIMCLIHISLCFLLIIFLINICVHPNIMFFSSLLFYISIPLLQFFINLIILLSISKWLILSLFFSAIFMRCWVSSFFLILFSLVRVSIQRFLLGISVCIGLISWYWVCHISIFKLFITMIFLSLLMLILSCAWVLLPGVLNIHAYIS